MNVDRTPQTIYIRTEFDIEKVLLFLRSNARRVRFWVDPRLVEEVLNRLEQFARKHPWKIAVEIVRADREKILAYAVGGAAIGAVVGGTMGGFAGAASGAMIGGACGAAFAHLQVTVDLGGESGGALVTLQ